MRGTRLLIGLFAIGATLSSAGACSRVREAGGDLSPVNSIGLLVENNYWRDVDVYIVSNGLATRMGLVISGRTQTFDLDPSVVAQDFRIVATPLAGNGRASSGQVVASAGQTIDFKIGLELRNSTVFVR